jgi:antitoxin HigA-1
MVISDKIKPMHPGELLREEILPEAGITQTALAEAIGVSRLTISEIVREKRAVSADLANRLALYFGTSPELWLNLQRSVDLWEARKAHRKIYQRIQRHALAQ